MFILNKTTHKCYVRAYFDVIKEIQRNEQVRSKPGAKSNYSKKADTSFTIKEFILVSADSQ